ncbi:MAG: hypothetical protein UR85_C0003G0085 [Candidatus Nomurabacteria bacterium GW2011_GWF2_35_66]|uniref:Uncharacterized protein n=1 Tax=Candidatus Nomurabacteria bacterium GW2011_GWE1_35_16 TaxID=1618761 RepID=A0A0G0B8T4_9BACT|nr:MAG: hypothetical protein UR55_C0005G0084 [Candidatus Nomurabacteria bacterium GW2011_GWF1_34_20]KKP63412.1 MAG: hypothetical protein UR57_C0005G0084 [Candidatus Nomurabacteria bacterium GW2011_GWE2_34_25]KKP65793.1 MAG: hypothetical protein UR64_C0018G0015 [Candidatus Nomurabacteria bacterium GW2011_GWE1_35_16]KKP83650.1 MAG: hypothetical protein UR85_C0003G0085 [Candidatus Nomurabacteria bacterium GW2011_GWF2_35_66]HAE36909.1 hypothetical protein [Candidatus Nomurabacteria bacterium]
MENLYKVKQIGIIILIIIIIGAIVLSIKTNMENEVIIQNENPVNNTVEEITPVSICYYRADKTDRGFYDKAWLKLNILGNKVTGEFQHLPAESDSKVGTFEGIISPLNQKSMSRSSLVWWNSRAEGMEVKEELDIKWGDGSATVGFGEMIDRGDGVYVYKNKDNLSYIKSMSQIDCEYLDEQLFVENYIRDNIATIVTNKPVLGGTWYTIAISINPSTKTGEVTYEDGHIQSKASFIYSYNKSNGEILFPKFEIKK